MLPHYRGFQPISLSNLQTIYRRLQISIDLTEIRPSDDNSGRAFDINSDRIDRNFLQAEATGRNRVISP